MNDKMWSIFEKTGNIEAFLYIEESKKINENKLNSLNCEISEEIDGTDLRKENYNNEC